MKYWKISMFAWGMLLLGIVLLAQPAKANSAIIQLSMLESEIQKGDEFHIICQVSSQTPYLDAEFRILYDASMMDFIRGGQKVTGGSGVLYVSTVGNDTSTYKKTFSLQFAAKKAGDSGVKLDRDISITDEEGNQFSVSSNQLIVSVKKKKDKEETEITDDSELPVEKPDQTSEDVGDGKTDESKRKTSEDENPGESNVEDSRGEKPDKSKAETSEDKKPDESKAENSKDETTPQKNAENEKEVKKEQVEVTEEPTQPATNKRGSKMVLSNAILLVIIFVLVVVIICMSIVIRTMKRNGRRGE